MRPTSDRVREALASALEARGAIAGARVLELFAGTGALSFEALSRGASSALLVDSSPRSRKALERNARALELEGLARVVDVDLLADPSRVARALEGLGPFELVFVDPPYAEVHGAGPLLDAVAAAGLLSEDALVALEGPAGGDPPAMRRLAPVRVYRYGDTLVSLLETTRSP